MSGQVTLMGTVLLKRTAASVLVTGRVHLVGVEDGLPVALSGPDTIMAGENDDQACRRAEHVVREEVCHNHGAPHVTPIAIAIAATTP